MTQWLLKRLGEFEDRPAIIWRDQSYSYGQLLEGVACWRSELTRRGVRTGESVAFYGDYSPNTCALLLALITNHNVVVPLTSSVAHKKEEFLAVTKAGVIIEFDRNNEWRFQQRAIMDHHPLLQQLREQNAPGLVLFSSGSTGKSKAALHNFSKLLDKFKPNHRSKGRRTLTFLLLDHIGGINTLFYVLTNGGTMISIDERNPAAICQAIQYYQVQLLPTSPTFLKLLLISEAYKGFDLSSLELVTYGTEPMPASTLKHLNEIFPNVQFKQTYGLSELGILRSRSRSSDSLWVKVGGEGFETKVVDGILWIRAHSAMLGYLNAPSPFDDKGWFNTGDEVEVDGEYLRILGRRSEIINVGGLKVYPAEIEGVLMQMDNIRDATVYGESNPIMGQIVAARVNLCQPEELNQLKKRLRSFCQEKLAPYKIPVKIEITEQEQFNARYKKIRWRPEAIKDCQLLTVEG